MTAVKTLHLESADIVSHSFIEASAPIFQETLTPVEKFRQLGREIVEWRKSQGLPEEDDITMEEIVVIVKEARAEVYAEEQAKKSTRR